MSRLVSASRPSLAKLIMVDDHNAEQLMPKQNKKPHKRDLPSKICPICERSFTWRKKWAKDWDAVKYCSERCRRRKNQAEAQS